jgi:hypothetical protein
MSTPHPPPCPPSRPGRRRGAGLGPPGWLLVAGLLAGCEAEFGALPGEPAAVPTHAATGWESIGTGVSHKQRDGGDPGRVLLVYAGCAASVDHATRWADNLVSGFFAARGAGHVFAVQGPAPGNCGYARRPIQNSRLAARLSAIAPTGWITIVAFSSGDLVANELIASEHGGTARFPPPGAAAVHYYNLEGESWGARRRGVDHYFAVYVPDSPYAERVRREQNNGARLLPIGGVTGDPHYGVVTPAGTGNPSDYARRPTLGYLEATAALYD